MSTGKLAEHADHREPGHRSIVAELSREIVRIYSRYYGRGPTKARTVFHNDVIVTVLEEIFTKAEQVLVHAGHFEQVRANRQAFQDEVEPLFRQVAESITGRRVRAFLSQVTEDGIAVEVFVLIPAEDLTSGDARSI
jgi:uncharacterized protein YbcI